MIRVPTANPNIDANFRGPRISSANIIRLDYSGVGNSLNNLSRAVGNGPRYREVDVSSGIQDAAKAASSTVSDFQKLQQQDRENNDRKLLFNVETDLAVASEEIEGKLQAENDPNKFAQIAEEHMAGLQFNTEGMSPEALESFNNYRERVTKLTVARARNKGFVENEKQMVKSAVARSNIAKRNNDIPGAIEPLKVLHEVGAITTDEFVDMSTGVGYEVQGQVLQQLRAEVDVDIADGNYNAAREKVQAQHFLGTNEAERQRLLQHIDAGEDKKNFANAMTADPQRVMAELENPESEWVKGKEQYEVQARKEQTYQEIQNQSMLATSKAIDQMLQDGKLKESDLDSPQFKSLTAPAKAELKKRIKEGAANNPTEWMAFAHDITNFQSTGDTLRDDLALTDMQKRVMVGFNSPYKEQLLNLIEDKRKGDATDSSSMAKSLATEYFKEGFLGNFTVAYEPSYSPNAFARIMGYDAKPGTALSPKDQAMTSKSIEGERRIEKGDPVEDVALKDKAQKRLSGILTALSLYQKQGKSAEFMEEFVRKQAQTYRLGTPLKDLTSPSSSMFLPAARTDAETKKAQDFMDQVLKTPAPPLLKD